jgi:hypothetical protein
VDTAIEQLHRTRDPHRGLAAATETITASLPGCVAAVLLADDDGVRVAAASADSLAALLCLDAACTDGPAADAMRTVQPQILHRIPRTGSPEFGAAAQHAGFAAAYALPIGRTATGCLLVLATEPYALDRSTLGRLRTLTSAMAAALPDETDPEDTRAQATSAIDQRDEKG